MRNEYCESETERDGKGEVQRGMKEGNLGVGITVGM